MDGWMRMLEEARVGLVTCWTMLESLEGDLGCSRRYLERDFKENWDLLPRVLRSRCTLI